MGHRRVAIGLMAGAVLFAGAGAAVAGVSDGNYRPDRLHCSGTAEDQTSSTSNYEPDCNNFMISVSDGNDPNSRGHELAWAGLPQLHDGDSPDPTAVRGGTGEGFDPTTGVRLFVGADDNLDNGEHDGSDQLSDGPSDGGAVVLNIDPASVARWFDALSTGDAQYLATHPLPLIDAGFGSCADGVCESVQTQRRVIIDGGAGGGRDVANYDGHTWDSPDCSSADPQNCGDNPKTGLSDEYHKNGQVYAEPGVQVYEDPSPAGSPIGPYPLPGLYVGTCGVIAGGGPAVPPAPASPFTNSAGQVVVPTTC